MLRFIIRRMLLALVTLSILLVIITLIPNIAPGDPARKILQVAKSEQADLIAMGGRGLGGAESLLSGSVSYKVNHDAPCNCLIVR